MARPLAIVPDSAIGPSNHRVPPRTGKAEIVPAATIRAGRHRIKPSAPFSTALCANFWLMTSKHRIPTMRSPVQPSRAPSEVVIIGTLCFSHRRTCSSRLLICF